MSVPLFLSTIYMLRHIKRPSYCWDSSIALGLILSMALQRIILGELPPIHGLPKEVQETHVVLLFSAAALFTLVAVFMHLSCGYPI